VACADEAGEAGEAGEKSAYAPAQHWADLSIKVTIKRLPTGHDPASAPLQRKELEYG